MDTAKKPCMKTCLISFVGVYAFIMLYTFVVHGQLLKADYEATASLWRPMEEMQTMAVWCWLYHGLLAAIVTCWFKKVRACHAACSTSCSTEAATTCCPVKSGGLCFGVKLGLVLGLTHAASYIWMPIPQTLAIKWFFSELFMGIGIGAVLGMLCRGKSCDKGGCEAKAE